MIPFLKKFSKKPPISYFLVLILKNEKANAVIFAEEEAKIRVIGKCEEYFQDSIEKASDEEFLETLDKVISKAEESLPQNSETQKTIFGIKEDWIENNKIKKEYLLKLKKASDALGLVPIGFLVISEAIAHFLQKEEGAPISAIFVDCGKKFITISLLKVGKLLETKTAEIHESIVYTADALLKHLEAPEILPSRIVVYDGEENLNQEFISHQWSKSLPFLHIPQTTNLPAGFAAEAILFGAASQMGFEVLKDTVEKKTETLKNEQAEEETISKSEDISLPEEFGFAKEKDVAKTYLEKPITTNVPKEAPTPKSTMETATDKNLFRTMIRTILNISKKIINLRKSLSSIPLPKNILGKKLIIVPVLIIILVLALIFFYLFGVRTTITLKINPKIVEQTDNVVFSTSNEIVSPSDKVIPGGLISITEEGQDSTPTTGKKDIGDKAKGTVTIFNSTLTTTTFPQGTTITSSNSLIYVLSNNVTVASGSGDAISGISPGKANVNVSSNDIGSEYNLPSATKFLIGNNPLIAAKNDNPFSGGTKKQVTVVTKADVDKLLTELPKANEQKAKDDLTKKLSPEEKLLPIFTQINIEQKSFDKKIGDEAASLTLKANISYEGLSYKQNDLTAFAKKLLESKVPSNLTVNYNDVKIDVKDIDKKNDKEVDVKLNIKGLLVPKLDEKKLVSEIAGMSYQKAEGKLAKLPQVASVKISSSLSLPFLKVLSKTPDNIKILLNISE